MTKKQDLPELYQRLRQIDEAIRSLEHYQEARRKRDRRRTFQADNRGITGRVRVAGGWKSARG
jgi:hypothetical protein